MFVMLEFLSSHGLGCNQDALLHESPYYPFSGPIPPLGPPQSVNGFSSSFPTFPTPPSGLCDADCFLFSPESAFPKAPVSETGEGSKEKSPRVL